MCHAETFGPYTRGKKNPLMSAHRWATLLYLYFGKVIVVWKVKCKKDTQNWDETPWEMIFYSLSNAFLPPPLTYIPPAENDKLFTKHILIIGALECLYSFLPLFAVLFFRSTTGKLQLFFQTQAHLLAPVWSNFLHIMYLYEQHDMAERAGGLKSVKFPLPLTSMTLSKFLKVLEIASSCKMGKVLPKRVIGRIRSDLWYLISA